MPTPKHPESGRPPLDLAQAAAYLNVSERFVRRLVAERRIAFHKVGHFLRFRAEDLDAFLEAGRVEPVESRSRLGAWSVPARSGRGGGRR
jgi:excisionase family DNA binding protein